MKVTRWPYTVSIECPPFEHSVCSHISQLDLFQATCTLEHEPEVRSRFERQSARAGQGGLHGKGSSGRTALDRSQPPQRFPLHATQVFRTLACLHAVGTVIAQRVRLKRKQFDSTRISLLSSQAIETLINDDMINDDMINDDMINDDIEAPPSIYI